MTEWKRGSSKLQKIPGTFAQVEFLVVKSISVCRLHVTREGWPLSGLITCVCPSDPVRCVRTPSPAAKGRRVGSSKLLWQGYFALAISYCLLSNPELLAEKWRLPITKTWLFSKFALLHSHCQALSTLRGGGILLFLSWDLWHHCWKWNACSKETISSSMSQCVLEFEHSRHIFTQRFTMQKCMICTGDPAI